MQESGCLKIHIEFLGILFFIRNRVQKFVDGTFSFSVREAILWSYKVCPPWQVMGVTPYRMDRRDDT